MVNDCVVMLQAASMVLGECLCGHVTGLSAVCKASDRVVMLHARQQGIG